MRDKNDITAPDLYSGTKIKQLIHPKWPSVLCCFSATSPQKDQLEKATTLVTGGDTSLLVSLIHGRQLPEYIPILHLGTGDTIPSDMDLYGTERIVDYLALPVSREMLLHRIALLVKVQKISAEHFINKTTLSRQLNLLSTRDGLTGLFNRRHLTNRLRQLFQSAKATGENLSLLLLNIDYFSTINKTWGLEFGDTILNELGARLTETTDKTASCYRFSGEEFMILLPGATLQESRKTALKLRDTCSEKPFTDGRGTINLTISVGIASVKEHQPEDYNELISMTEAALFMAKAEGRNRVQIYLPKNERQDFSSERSLAFLKENLNRILEKTKSSAIDSLQLLAKNIAGPAHQQHIDSVSNYVALLGKQLGLPEQHIRTFQNSITLYNSFRFLLHNGLLSKPGNLTRDERKIIEDLPFKLNELTDMFDYFAEERNVLLGHSEHYDGSGYPLGLKGDAISLGARIFNIVDALAAMNAERPYRRKLSPKEIIEELKKEAGKQFDPYLVLQILTVIKKNKLLQLEPDYLDQTQQDLINVFPQLLS